MRLSQFIAVLPFFLLPVLGRIEVHERPKDEKLAAEKYDNGKVHEELIKLKTSLWSGQRGPRIEYEYPLYPPIDEHIPCVDGTAVANASDPTLIFKCNNIDLYSFKNHLDLGSTHPSDGSIGSSSWGWTSPEGREIVVFGQADAAVFIEISSEGKIIYLGRLPKTIGSAEERSLWREIRTYKNYAIIGSESENHGIQIFDLTKLLTIDPASPVTFDPSKDLTGFFNDLPIGRTHNVVVNEAMGYAVSVGAMPRNSTQASGLIFIDLDDPANPTTPGYNAADGYVHDAQCLPYKGPDEKYQGKDICYGYNEDTLTIYDVTDRANSSIISITSYDGAQYTHQGWVLDKEWQTFLLLDDELDEYYQSGAAANGRATTYIWNITSLESPKLTGYYQAPVTSIDHNQYVWDGFVYQSNYASGIRILDVRSIPEDPTGSSITEVAYFDIFPEDDDAEGGGWADFWGTWSSYGGFKSGYIFVNTMERGVFIVKRTDT